MNRERLLFVVVLAIALLWGTTSLLEPFDPGATPSPRVLSEKVPVLPDLSAKSMAAKYYGLVAGWNELAPAHSGRGRTAFVPHSDLLPVSPAVLDMPRALVTQWVLPLVPPSPPAGWYRWFGVDEIGVVPPAPAGAEAASTGSAGAPPPEGTEAPGGSASSESPPNPAGAENGGSPEANPPNGSASPGGLLGQKKKLDPDAWDKLYQGMNVFYGTISLQAKEVKAGHKKYELLLPEGKSLPFYWEQINPDSQTVESGARLTLSGSSFDRVEFADTIENRYWSKRTVEHVSDKDEAALLALGRWVMGLAEDAKYDRIKGLDLAEKTFREARKVKPRDVTAILALGEALHREFDFDAELGLYQKAIAQKPAAELYLREGRLFRALGLDGKAVEVLTKGLALSGADTTARSTRAEACYSLGRYEDAEKDFSEVERIGSPEEKVAAREGRARCLIAMSEPAKAVDLLGDATDARSLVTKGAALWAQEKWPDALTAFQAAVAADPSMASALVDLGFAQAMTAKDASGVKTAIASLEKARAMDPLEYFWPPLGEGFARQRLDQKTESVDQYTEANDALPSDPYVNYVIGRCYLRDGRYADARMKFLAALGLDYRFVPALYGAGTASMALSDWAAARVQLGRVVTLDQREFEATKDPDHKALAKTSLLRAQYRLARAYLLSNDLALPKKLAGAKEQLKAVADLDDTFVPALNAMAYLTYLGGDAEKALTQFDRAMRLVPRDKSGEADATYAKDSKKKILDSLSRRRWVDEFDLPNGTVPAGLWTIRSGFRGQIEPRIQGGKAVIAGRVPARSGENAALWMVVGDPVKSRRQNRLASTFIRFRTTVTSDPAEQVKFRILAFTQRRNGKIIACAGIGRNELGHVVKYWKAARNQAEKEEEIKDPAGKPVMWPKGDVTVEIERTNPEKGVFAISLNGERVGTVEAGITNKQTNPMQAGFQVSASPGTAFKVTVDDVEMEIYL